jgi:hypothetical protein
VAPPTRRGHQPRKRVSMPRRAGIVDGAEHGAARRAQAKLRSPSFAGDAA